MRKNRPYIGTIVVFILAQLAWMALVALWIYWYTSNYIIFTEVNDKLYPQIAFGSTQIAALVGGLILLTAVSTGLWLIFARLRREIDVMRKYDNFIAHVTHELKSPLASIQLHLETMRSRDVPKQKRHEFFEYMLMDAHRLDNRINSILEIARREERNVPYQFQKHEIDIVVKELLQEAVAQYRLPDGAVEVIGSGSCICMIDRNALKIVVNNLVDNTIKYSVGTPHMTARISRKFKKLSIEFADRGVGISLNEQKQVFKKYWRHDGADIPNVTGTGLGLYWVREIVRRHRGRVGVFSRGKGTGTTFRILLPIHQEHDMMESVPGHVTDPDSERAADSTTESVPEHVGRTE